MAAVGEQEVGMSPFLATTSEITTLPNAGVEHVGILVNCGLHASRVVGRGGTKIHELMERTRATLRVTRSSGLCEITGERGAVQDALQEVLKIVEDGDMRDLRAAVSQALPLQNSATGLVVAAPRSGAVGVEVAWKERDAPPSSSSPLEGPIHSTDFVVPLTLR